MFVNLIYGFIINIVFLKYCFKVRTNAQKLLKILFSKNPYLVAEEWNLFSESEQKLFLQVKVKKK